MKAPRLARWDGLPVIWPLGRPDDRSLIVRGVCRHRDCERLDAGHSHGELLKGLCALETRSLNDCSPGLESAAPALQAVRRRWPGEN